MLVIHAAYLLIGVSVFLLARALLRQEESRAVQENLDDLRSQPSSNRLVRITRPIFAQYIVPTLRGKAFWDEPRRKYRSKLISAGLKDELKPDELIAFKLSLIFVFPAFLTALKLGDFYDFSWGIIALSAVLGWFYPDLWIRSRVEARRRQIRRSLPFVVDLLALSTEAGLDFIGAIGKVVEKAKPSPLIEELEQVMKEIKVGSSRADALREMTERIDMSEINSFVAILISADQMGAPIGRVLREQSEQIRNQRFVAAEKAGAQAVPKIQVATMALLVPAVMIMVLGPILPGCLYSQ